MIIMVNYSIKINISSFDWGALVAQSVERWTCKVAGSNPGLEGPCGTISICSAPCAVPVFRKRHQTEAPSQSPNGAGS